MITDRRPVSFGRTFMWVVLAHVAVILVIGFWRIKPSPPPPIQWINMLPPGALVHGTAALSEGPQVRAHAVARAPEPSPAPPQVKTPAPTPPTPPAPEKTPEPETSTATEDQSTPAPSPIPINSTQTHAPEKTAATPSKPKKPRVSQVKVNLDEEVVRSPSASSTSTAGKGKSNHGKGKIASDAEEGSDLDASTVASRLGSTLKSAGVTDSVLVGVSGSEGGNGGEFSDFYNLIRNQMMNAWNQPIQFAGKHFVAQIQITVEKDGQISNVALGRSSGNGIFDASAMEAARQVKKISASLPEGCPPNISVNFRLTE